jgi:hypothetical protein
VNAKRKPFLARKTGSEYLIYSASWCQCFMAMAIPKRSKYRSPQSIEDLISSSIRGLSSLPVHEPHRVAMDNGIKPFLRVHPTDADSD